MLEAGATRLPMSGNVLPESAPPSRKRPRNSDDDVDDDYTARHAKLKNRKQSGVEFEKYKTRTCRNFQVYGSCRYADLCQFAHGSHELRQPKITAAKPRSGVGGGADDIGGGAPPNVCANTFQDATASRWVPRREGSTAKRCIRMAGGRAWEDKTLDDWPADDFRLFIGNLANDVNDLVLTTAFSPYNSFLKAKVIRSKHDNKSKGYGFVSFGNPFECAKAMRAMEGKYVGSRPVKIKKSNWQERNIGHVRRQGRNYRRANVVSHHLLKGKGAKHGGPKGGQTYSRGRQQGTASTASHGNASTRGKVGTLAWW